MKAAILCCVLGGTMLLPLPNAFAQPVCDQLVGRLLTPPISTALQSLGCGDLASLGLDRAEHQLSDLCYSSAGGQSTLSFKASLRCATSDSALFQTEIEEDVSATATVDANSCSVLELQVRASGEIGNLFVHAFDVEGEARAALDAAVTDLCR